MEIVTIYPDYLYAVKFDDKKCNEYNAAFDLWSDLDYLVEFFDKNKDLIDTDFWETAYGSITPEYLAHAVINEAYDFAAYIKEVARNTMNGSEPDYDTFFKELGGKYKYMREYIPHKSYGTSSPSMLRLYAVRLQPNCYVVVHGGHKVDPQDTRHPTAWQGAVRQDR